MQLSEDMKRVVTEQRLGFVATVRPDGTPALSPKGTTSVWNDHQLVFLHLHSIGTVTNLAWNPALEINVVDPIMRKGWRFAGRGTVHVSGPIFDEVIDHFARIRPGLDAQAAVIVDVDRAEPLISPAYDDGSSEEQVFSRWLAHHLLLHAPTDPPAE